VKTEKYRAMVSMPAIYKDKNHGRQTRVISRRAQNVSKFLDEGLNLMGSC
jgi:hypothetical protein